MKYLIISVGLIVLGGIIWMSYFYSTEETGNKSYKQANEYTMNITSTAFEHEGNIPAKYTCDGTNTNPPLSFENIPMGTQSLALIMDDPDVPPSVREDRMWDHWIIWNIDQGMMEIKEGTEPEGVHGTTTSNTLSYVGPCPPDREHRYFFKLYAIDTLLSIPEGSSKAEVEGAMEGHILEEAILMGRYERN